MWRPQSKQLMTDEEEKITMGRLTNRKLAEAFDKNKRTVAIGGEVPQGKTDITFIDAYLPQHRGHWSLEKVRTAVGYAQRQWSPKDIAEKLKVKESGVKAIFAELRRAARSEQHYQTLEEYWAAGRPQRGSLLFKGDGKNK